MLREYGNFGDSTRKDKIKENFGNIQEGILGNSPESGGKEGTKFNISGYLTIISWLLRDIFGNIQGIIPEKSQKFPVVRGKGGSSLTLGDN